MSPSVKGLVVVVLLAGLLFGFWQMNKEWLYRGQRPTEGTLLLNDMEKNGIPDFSLTDIKGREIRLSDFKGKVVIVNFWASWCAPCVTEFPSLLELVRLFPDRLILLAVSADRSKEDMLRFLQAFEVNEPNLHVLWDKNMKVMNGFGTEVLPESYIIGKDGRLIRKVVGVDDWSSADARSFFKSLF